MPRRQGHDVNAWLVRYPHTASALLQVFDHNHHFDHLLDAAYEVEEDHTTPNGPDGLSPLSSSDDLSGMDSQRQSAGGAAPPGQPGECNPCKRAIDA